MSRRPARPWRMIVAELPNKLRYAASFGSLLKTLMRNKVLPAFLTHHQRKRLWWRALRMSHAAYRQASEARRSKLSRKEWCQIIYRVLIRYPDDFLRGA